jgi:hypothetical protein
MESETLPRDTERAMSEENVEICKRAFRVFERLDVEAGLEYLDPEIVFQSAIVSSAEGNSYRGHDGLRSGQPRPRAPSLSSERSPTSGGTWATITC